MSRFGPLPDPAELLDHDEAAAAFAAILDSTASDEAITLHELSLAVAAQVAAGGTDVQPLVDEWGDRFVTALDAVDGDYTRSC